MKAFTSEIRALKCIAKNEGLSLTDAELREAAEAIEQHLDDEVLSGDLERSEVKDRWYETAKDYMVQASAVLKGL